MNINDSLLGHLASRLSPHPENVATEALAFILSRSEHVRRAVLQFLEGLGVPPPHVVFFGAQKAEENNARPDLRGVDENGTPVLFIEAKFWAGLTDRQPVAYLAALPTDRPTALLVVAPEARRQTLWRELLRRCAVGVQGGATELGHGHGPHSITQIGPSKFLVLVAWKPFLESLRSAAYAQGDRVSAEDLNQLLGLCTREDTTAFLPLRSEELSAGVGRRLYQFATLVDEVCDEAVRQGICSSKGTSGSGKIYYWRRARLVEHEFTLQFSPWRWHTLAETPFWLLFPEDKACWPALLQSLQHLALETPPMLLRDPNYYDFPVIPLYPQVAVEHREVIQSLVNQLHRIGGLISGATS